MMVFTTLQGKIALSIEDSIYVVYRDRGNDDFGKRLVPMIAAT